MTSWVGKPARSPKRWSSLSHIIRMPLSSGIPDCNIVIRDVMKYWQDLLQLLPGRVMNKKDMGGSPATDTNALA